tara:strand:- start:2247 stop:4052 length:1806 start_codon:yes stop_codon:yes gene_type:complete
MLNIPEKFRIDTDSKTIDLKPLVIIDERFYLSTSKESLEEFIFKPLIKNIGSIKESIDIQNKTFKISSITLSLYNYKYDDEYLSDMIFSPSVMNKKITIYMKSQSAKNLGDCLEVYSGYVKNIKESSGVLSLSAEDKTDEVLNKKVPYKFVRDDINLPEKYRNEPIPIVYGYVDKAPCVYYDLYSTTIENGSRDWAITPDLFAIKSINFPYIFSNDTYGKIPTESWIFEDQKGGTIYRNGTSDQYQILGNRILIPKAIEMGESPEQSIQGVVAPVTAFGMIEVHALQDASFNSSFFRFDFRENQQQTISAKTNIVAYSEEEGINPTENVENSYLMVKDFSSESGIDFPFNHWLWGDQSHPDYELLFGESTMNFEVNNFFSDSKVVKELTINNESSKEINHIVQLNFILEANLTELTDGESPKFIFGYTDTSGLVWNPSSYNEVSTHPDTTYTVRTEEIYIEDSDLPGGGVSTYAQTKNPSHNNFFIGQRHLVGENWTFESQTGIVNWLKIIKLKLFRRVLLKDFIDFEIFADVEGRVDTVSGDYTGERQLTSGERADFSQRREGVQTFSPRKSISLDRRITDTKVTPRITKRVLRKKGTKY